MSENKVLIIGGNSGIGDATRLLIHERHALKAETPLREYLDVSYVRGVQRYLEANGPFTHIVYSAGINQLAWVRNDRIAFRMEEHLETNCIGFVNLISEHTRTFPDAHISAVAVSSDAGTIPMRGSVAYCVSKAALNMAVKVMARELAPHHRINAVAPGIVADTNMTEYIDAAIPVFRGWTPEFAHTYERQSIPTGRRATLEEVAETISWVLFGPEQMTGAIIEISGGRS